MWPEPEPSQQAFKEALGRSSIATLLHQDVEHDAILVHYTPEIMQHAVDPQEYLIKVPGVTWPGPKPS